MNTGCCPELPLMCLCQLGSQRRTLTAGARYNHALYAHSACALYHCIAIAIETVMSQVSADIDQIMDVAQGNQLI